MKLIERREVPGLAGLYLAELPGSGMRMIEFVDTIEPGVPKYKKWVLMISTQFGCAVGCRMCDAGSMGFHGNLKAGEMLAQVRKVLADNPGLDPGTHPKLKIHFARMGEPTLNPEVLEALRLLPAEVRSPGLMPSLSTVAPKSPEAEDFLEKLIGVKNTYYGGGGFQLQFSVHASEPALRKRIVPIQVWSLEEIASYGKRFVRPGDRKITLNFALSQGERLEPEKLRSIFDPAMFLIKVTPVNPTCRAEKNGSVYVWNDPSADLAKDSSALEKAGFTVILSPSAREEIAAETSCGQLWAAQMKRRAMENMRKRDPRGKTLPFNWARSALLVVDMQEFFLDPASPAYMPQALPALSNAVRLARHYRERGLPVLFSTHAHTDPEHDGGLMTLWWGKVCMAGTPAARVSGLLSPRENEIFIKCRYNALASPELTDKLRALNVNSLVVAGLKTNLCVESTVRSAFDLGIKCIVAEDAVSARTPELHKASLNGMADGYAMIRTTEEILAAAGAADQRLYSTQGSQ